MRYDAIGMDAENVVVPIVPSVFPHMLVVSDAINDAPAPLAAVVAHSSNTSVSVPVPDEFPYQSLHWNVPPDAAFLVA
jgi:uncharacterized membrane protein YdfJ with MMPL/SSD domain